MQDDRRLAKTDEWREWSLINSTRPHLENCDVYRYPVLRRELGAWQIFHPYSDYYMLVPVKEYIENMQQRLDGRYSLYTPSKSRVY